MEQFEITFETTPLTPHSVSEITRRLKQVIDRDPQFQNVWVQGQVSNYSRSSRGYVYFTLKDERNQIKCAVFRGSALRFQLRDGDEVIVKGGLSLYTARSEYQIVVNAVEPVGIGALQRAFEELKAALEAEGLFAVEHKKPLPQFPKKIGVITSATGAAFQDIKRFLGERYRLAELVLHPSLVQGHGAAAEIARAIAAMNRRDDIDVLIVGRGGGSIEDLWAFNEEPVARAIFASKIPIVSAVGHETDYTISDFVADRRVPTPSGVVQIVPDQAELAAQIEGTHTWLRRTITDILERRRTQLEEINAHLSPTRRMDSIHQHHQRVDDLEAACRRAMQRRLDDSHRELNSVMGQLDALSPLATLKRGYNIGRNADGQLVTSVEQIAVGEHLYLQLADGRLRCRVETKEAAAQQEG